MRTRKKQLKEHKDFVKIWGNLEEITGAKARVNNLGHSHQRISGILNNSYYQDKDYLILLTNACKQVASDLTKKIIKADKKIQSI